MRRDLLAFFGHHKCASSWAEAICGDAGRELKLRSAILYEDSDFDGDLAQHVKVNSIDFLLLANATRPHLDQLPAFRGFHLVRDPRDIVVSAYFSHLKTHPTHAWPELIEYRENLTRVSKDEGLLMEMDFRRAQFEQMSGWDYERPDVLELRMEDAVSSPYASFLRIFRFLDLVDEEKYTPRRRLSFVAAKAARRLEHALGHRLSLPFTLERLPAERLLGIVWEHDFAKKAPGRKHGEEDRTSHYRKGTPGDWRNHFSPMHVQRFKERYNDLLLRLGYETTEDWSTESALAQ